MLVRLQVKCVHNFWSVQRKDLNIHDIHDISKEPLSTSLNKLLINTDLKQFISTLSGKKNENYKKNILMYSSPLYEYVFISTGIYGIYMVYIGKKIRH